MGFWDHWVPGANQASTDLVNEWAAKEKVDVSIDYITSQGNKNLLTIAAEAQARSGHDIFAFPTWQPSDQANRLEPVDDVMAGGLHEYVDALQIGPAESSGAWHPWADGDGPTVYLFRCLHCDWYGGYLESSMGGDPDAWKRKVAALPHRMVQWLASKFR